MFVYVCSQLVLSHIAWPGLALCGVVDIVVDRKAGCTCLTVGSCSLLKVQLFTKPGLVSTHTQVTSNSNVKLMSPRYIL